MVTDFFSWFMQWTREGMATLAALNVLVCDQNPKKRGTDTYFSNQNH